MTLDVARTMVGAEILKLRRNRPLLAFALLLTVGVIVLFFGYGQLQHAAEPARHAPAGGTDGFQRAIQALGLYFGGLAAILIGSEAGTADRSSGVLRDLVATGRSRLALYAVRTPAAIVLTWAFTGAAFVLAVLGTYTLAGSLPTPGGAVVLKAAAWVALATAVQTSLAVALGTFTGSRALTLTAVIGWQTIATELLVNTSSLGSVREGLLSVGLGQFLPVGHGFDVPTTTGVAIAVVLAWTIVPVLVAGFRMRTVDV